MRLMLFLAGGAALGLVLAVCIGGVASVAVLLSGPSTPVGAVEPSQKAVLLAQSISEALNTAAFAALLLVPAGAFVGWRRARARREQAPSK
jgi:hypothetical protein